MLPELRDYDRLYAAFRWQIPERYNIGVDVCDRWAAADPSRIAIIDVAASGGVETLTFAPIDLRLVEPSLMTPDEIAWLDAYHAEVFAVLSPAFDAEERAWLAEKCAPIA